MTFKTFLSALALAVSAAAAHAAPLTLDGGWSSFSASYGKTSSWNTSFEFTLTESALLQVTDTGDNNDMYMVTVASSGTSTDYATSTPVGGYAFSNDPDYTFGSDAFSSLEVLLEAGSYVITGRLNNTTYSAGTGSIQIVSPTTVPLPASGLLLLGAFGGVVALRRKSRA